MSPSTGVLAFLAKYAKDLDIIAEQAEDEIAAINMGLGAWYAGARAMVTTSGGGFALMTEGVSLAGMIESPMVIHLAQRPGPATGASHPDRAGRSRAGPIRRTWRIPTHHSNSRNDSRRLRFDTASL